MSQLHLLSPHGFRGAAVYAGIKIKHTPDIGLLVCETRAAAAAVFTTNKVFAAPVKVGAWMVIIIVSRELAITGLRLLAASKHIVLAAERYAERHPYLSAACRQKK